MDTRNAILNYQYSEKMKSGLIIGAGLLEQVVSLKGEERSGGLKVLIGFLEGLLREVRIAMNVMGVETYRPLEGSVMELVGWVQMSQFEAARHSFAEAISSSTTLCQSSMSYLIEKKLV